MSWKNIKNISINKLLVNANNPRFEDVDTENEAIKNIIQDNPKKLLKLASDIVEKGLNPIDLPLVSHHPEKEGYFIVEEGNRRITAIKLLFTPELSKVVEDGKNFHLKFKHLSKQINPNELKKINCVVSDDKEFINHWIKLKHTGENDGVGTVSWTTEQKRRFEQKRLGITSPDVQMLDFIECVGYPPSIVKKIHKSNLKRLIDDPDVRSFLGLKLDNQTLKTNIPKDELLKGLNKIIQDLATQKIKVKHIYYKEDRKQYLSTFSESNIPDKSRVFQDYIPLNSLLDESSLKIGVVEQGNLQFDNFTTTSPSPSSNHDFDQTRLVVTNGKESPTPIDIPSEEINPPSKASRPRSTPISWNRKTLIPKEIKLKIPVKRINYIYRELQTLNVDDFPNSTAVLFRVFLELSIDDYINREKIKNCHRDAKLNQKIKIVSDYMKNRKILEKSELKPVNMIISSQDYFASTNTLNAYVHNPNVQPIPKDLKTTWDNIEKFIKALWN